MKFFQKIEDEILKQKVKEHFLQLGDENVGWFHALVKQKQKSTDTHNVVDAAWQEPFNVEDIADAFVIVIAKVFNGVNYLN